MKFEKIIEAAGLEPNDFPEVSKIDIQAFNLESQELKEEDFEFTQPIFAKNPISFNKFLDFLESFNPETDRIFPAILHESSLIITRSSNPLILPR